MLRESITDEIWEKIASLLPAPKGRHGNDNRQFSEAVDIVEALNFTSS
ncbi:hypothetical protein [Candidatus Neptunichlamydia sp. REUL1]|nr:hypothetical protein [Candidatus Neptunochlamydia sp. REUL1]